MNLVAITNFWDLQDKNNEAFETVYRAMVGDAYPRAAIEEAFEQIGYDPDMTDMSEYSYRPVITEQQAKSIEKKFGAGLRRATVKARPDIGPKLYELTHTSP